MSQLLEHVNGKGQQGRLVPPLPEHTFKDSGKTIRIRKVGPMTQQRMAQAIRKEIEEPMPPRNPPDSEAALLGEEFNYADPEYERKVKEREEKMTLLLGDRMLRYATLEAEVTIDDRAKTEIARAKRNMALSNAAWEPIDGLTDEENDRVFYILHICCATQDDLREFGKAIRERSMPTEEAVQRQIATFPGDVPQS